METGNAGAAARAEARKRRRSGQEEEDGPRGETDTDAPRRTASPFAHELRLTPARRLQVVLLGAVLVPLRVAAAALVLLLLWPIAWLRVAGLSPRQREQRITGWRSWLLHHIVLFLSRAVFFTLGFLWIRVKGQRARPQDAPLLAVAPHSSFLDTLVLVATDLPTVVSRSENLSLPVIGALLRFNQSLLVSRLDPSSRRRCVEQLTHRLTSQGAWPQVLIFPEGTTTSGRALLRFKPGAFVAGVPVQPVLLHYPNQLDTVRWTWKGLSWTQVMWYTASQLYTNVTVEFLPVYTPSQEERESPALFADNVRKVMARALGVPATEFVIEGSTPVTRVGYLSLPFEPPAREALVILAQRCDEGAQAVFEDLIERCQSEDERMVNVDQLTSLLRVMDRQAAQHIFTLYTQGKDSLLDLRQLAVSLAAVTDLWPRERLIHTAFTLYDSRGKGWVSEQEFSGLLGALVGWPQLHAARLYAESCSGSPGQLTLRDLQRLLTSHPAYRRLFPEYLRPGEVGRKETTPLTSGGPPRPRKGGATHQHHAQWNPLIQ
ncbi:lysophospholipid acyltransferase LPCAT4-like [Lepisosteus oculatus]|uniref:lysophospholipid acyltransferase LPCAT4-like n=1 Tax=Lepisosteus oculatus TaxID=7918 RepID=UPI0037215E93